MILVGLSVNLCNQMILFYPLRNLQNAGFTEVTVIVPTKYKPDDTIAGELQLKIDYVYVNIDTEEQGTAESVRLIRDKIKPNRHILLVTCDLVTNIDLSELCVRQRVSDALLTALLAPLPPQLSQSSVPGTRKKYQPERDIVALETETNRLLQFGAVADYSERIPFCMRILRQFPNMQVHSDLLDCHVYALHPRAVEFIMTNKLLATFKGEVLPKLVLKQFSKKDLKEQNRPDGDNFDSLRCYALVSKCFALRVNNLQAYKVANGEVQNIFKELYRPGANVSKDEAQPWPRDKVNKNVLGARVTIGQGCKVTSSVLHDDVKISDDAMVINSIICRGCVIGAKASVVNSFIGVRAIIPEGRVVNNESIGISNMEFE
ncbi:translation initiation factor eIF-2B subunit gamma-like isoform X1 [Varroa jacobsoni]|uniref:translation initiation factor eIF-2B subunit gamma-like isoform X1 n=1 Tax=Varroa jacobsoni TaxID=62625 RepID=UPI000BF72BF8|nr:translation initiation factor eIF-2B subunit gamma-like isoform X1 [Varroa jacobsoni]